MTTNFEKVGEFHEKFGLEHFVAFGEPPRLIPHDEFMFRLNLIMEETLELLLAHRVGDLEKFADALGDLLYVTYGLGHLSKISLDRVVEVIHEANMKKVRAQSDDDPLGKRGSKLDVVKPPGWEPPDIRKVLEEGFL